MVKGSHYAKKSDHPMYGKCHKEETIQKLKKAHIGLHVGEKNSFYGKHHTDKARKSQSESRMGKPAWNKGKKGIYSEETLQLMRESRKGNVPWNKGKTGVYSQEVLDAISKSRIGKSHTEEQIKKIAKSMLGKHAGEKNPMFGKPNPMKGKPSVIRGEKHPSFGKHRSEEIKSKLSQKAKERWRDEEFVDKMAKAFSIKPTKPEWVLGSLLDKLFPNEYQYVGDYSFWVDGKNPDFMNINGRKKLIELYGDYWHESEEEQPRIDHFKKYGFETLVIWEKELKNISKLKQNLQLFHEGQI